MNYDNRVKLIMYLAVFMLLAIPLVYIFNPANKKCTFVDNQIGNCVPAEKCSADNELDALLDCPVKPSDTKEKSTFRAFLD